MTDATDRAREALAALPPGGWLNEIAAPQLVRDLLSENDALRAELTALKAAIESKGGTEHAPTQWAYDQACATIERLRAEARAARVQGMRDAADIAERVRDPVCEKCGLHKSKHNVRHIFVGQLVLPAAAINAAAAALEKGQAND